MAEESASDAPLGTDQPLEHENNGQHKRPASDVTKTENELNDEDSSPPTKLGKYNLSEEELMSRTLPEYWAPNLDIVFIGINPGYAAADTGRWYAGPGNHFWNCLSDSGLVPEPMDSHDDKRLLEFGMGLANIVQRTTRTSSDLKSQEIKDGAELLVEKLKQYQPKIAVFNGKEIYRVFSGQKDFSFGKQPEPICGTDISVFVMPSSSARCAQLPRAGDKLCYYEALKKLRDFNKGLLPTLEDSEVTFPGSLSPSKSAGGNGSEKSLPGNGTLNKTDSALINGSDESCSGDAADPSRRLYFGSTDTTNADLIKTEPQSSSSAPSNTTTVDASAPVKTESLSSQPQTEQNRIEETKTATTGFEPTTTCNPTAPVPSQVKTESALDLPVTAADLDRLLGTTTQPQHPPPQHAYAEQPQNLAHKTSTDFMQQQQQHGMIRQQQPAATVSQQPVMDPFTTFGVGGTPGMHNSNHVTQQQHQSMGGMSRQPNVMSGTTPTVDPSEIENHIRESVAAVVQRCKDGTQEFPDHYIRPSTPPNKPQPPPPPPPPQPPRATAQSQAQQQTQQQAQPQQQQHHQQVQQQQQHQQQQQQAATQLLAAAGSLNMYGAGRAGTAQNQAQDPLNAYLGNYFQTQTAAYAPIRAMQAVTGGAYQGQAQWPNNLYDFTSQYFQQTAQQQQNMGGAGGGGQTTQQNAPQPAQHFYNYFGAYTGNQPTTQQNQNEQQNF